MNSLLIALLGTLLLPLFIATWGASLLGLATQGALLGWIALRMAGQPLAPHDWVILADTLVVRGLVAPVLLYRVLRARKATARNDVIPPNLLSWTFALGLVLVAFSFAEVLMPARGDDRTLVAVAVAGLLLGFLVLSTQSGPFSQIVGVLRVENAITLFELGGPRHEHALGLQLAQLVLFAVSVGFYVYYARTLGTGVGGEPAVEGPML